MNPETYDVIIKICSGLGGLAIGAVTLIWYTGDMGRYATIACKVVAVVVLLPIAMWAAAALMVGWILLGEKIARWLGLL